MNKIVGVITGLLIAVSAAVVSYFIFFYEEKKEEPAPVNTNNQFQEERKEDTQVDTSKNETTNKNDTKEEEKTSDNKGLNNDKQTISTNSDEAKTYTSISDAKKVKGKVNIYLFYGETCPHCEKLREFLSSIEKDYGKYYNLYLLEVWGNKDNASLMQQFADATDEEASGVPFMVIGEQTFIGYSSRSDDAIKEAIKTESKKGKDIYFDRIEK